MNIIFFIRLLLRHAWLLTTMPVMLFVIVFFLTREQPERYVSQTTIYTGIASGSSIVSLEDTRTDHFGTRTAFDNLIGIIKSKTTAEEVGLRLFTSHMFVDEPGPLVISKESYTALMKIVPPEIKALVVKGNFEKTLRNFVDYKEKDYRNFIYELVHLNHPHYSADKILGKLRASRVQASDMIEISYQSDDPGICYQTLKLVNEVFVRSYAQLKINQSDVVVNYFQNELDKAQEKLDTAERELLAFNQRNNIINYYEQTKHISSEKQIFELDYLKIKMNHAAAASVIDVLENKLTANQQRKINSREILNLRRQLAEVNLEMATMTLLTQTESTNEEEVIRNIAELKLKSYNIQEQLKKTVNQRYHIDNSMEGLATTSILEDWLDQVIEYESTTAQLAVGEQRKKEFQQLYIDYAPLGANMKRLERKISVAEREYLSLLQSLNTAKLKQQNIELNTNLKVAEVPFFPIQPEPGKRKYLLIIALMAGFLIPAFLIIALEFLDSNIKNVRRAETLSRLKVASIFPNMEKRNKKTDLPWVEEQASEKMTQKIILTSGKPSVEKKPVHIAFLSSYQGDGKTTLLKKAVHKMGTYGYRCMLITPDEVESSGHLDVIKYTPDLQFARIKNIKELIPPEKEDITKTFDFLFLEIPGLIRHPCPVGLLTQMDRTFLVTRANRPWKAADNNMVSDLLSIPGLPEPQILLNGLEITEMETIIGDLPGKRSVIRRIIKNLFSLQFFSKKSFRAPGEK